MKRTRWPRKPLLLSAVVAALLMVVTAAQAATTIGTLASWDGTSNFQYFAACGSGACDYGQVITVPSTDATLDSFVVEVKADTTIVIRGEVYAWDATSSRTTGARLWQSGPVSTSDASVFEQVTFTTGGIQLTAGEQYILVVTTARDTSSGMGMMGRTSGDLYTGGSFFYAYGDPATSSWSGMPTDYDLAFSATFSGGSGKADQATLSVTGPASATYGDADATITTSGGSGTGAVTFDSGSSTGCSIVDGKLHVTSGTGSCTITATKAADADYNAATSAPFTVAIYPAQSEDVLTPTNGTASTAYQGIALTDAVLGTFTDSNTAAVAGDFAAQVCWDGAVDCSAGTVTGGNGSFTVTGTHTYDARGSYTVTTTVTKTSANDATITTVVNVISPLKTTGGVKVTLDKIDKTLASITVAFGDADPAAVSGDYSVSIDWGDGATTSTATITAARRGWSLTASHDYAGGRSTYKVTVTITDETGATATATGNARIR